ncbi:MAG TPA: hypothetical protein VN721_00450 [Flavipsychrobacter sp.]|nr:hypothetical protein [Flavipsychrobacter sp.]
MKSLKAIFVLALPIILYTACEKNGTNTSPSKATIHSVTKGPDSSQSKFVPYTDTFYGMAYQYSYGTSLPSILCPAPDSDSVVRMYVYVFHLNQSEIKYSSSHPEIPINSGDPTMLEEISGGYTLDDSNNNKTNLLISLKEDSFFYARFHEMCSDPNITYFKGRRVNAHP